MNATIPGEAYLAGIEKGTNIMERRTKTFRVSVPITLERQKEDGQEVRYDTTVHGVFFYILPYTGDLNDVYLDDYVLKPELPFDTTFEEKGLIFKALNEAKADHMRQNT